MPEIPLMLYDEYKNRPDPLKEAIPALMSLIKTQTEKPRKEQFMQGVQAISQSQEAPDVKINKLIQLTAQNGTDYGFGIKDIVEQYGSQASRGRGVFEQADGKTVVPEGFEVVGYDQKGNPMIRKAGGLTNVEKRQKNLDTTKLITAVNENAVKRDMIRQATESSKKVKMGLEGKIRKELSRRFNPNDPMLGDWQKIKMALTDAQLLNTAKTKGAISDQEMKLFASAAANDDFSSIPAIMPVLDKLQRFMDAEEKSMKESYSVNYGDEAPAINGVSGKPKQATGQQTMKAKYGLK